MRKTTFLIGAFAGYVLGARAGRRRYEQISALAGRVWGNPTVQQAKEGAKDNAKLAAKNAGTNLRDAALNSSAAESVKEAAGRASTVVKDRLPGGSSAPAQPTPVATPVPKTTPTPTPTPSM